MYAYTYVTGQQFVLLDNFVPVPCLLKWMRLHFGTMLLSVQIWSNPNVCEQNTESRAAPGSGNLQRTVTPDLAVAH